MEKKNIDRANISHANWIRFETSRRLEPNLKIVQIPIRETTYKGDTNSKVTSRRRPGAAVRLKRESTYPENDSPVSPETEHSSQNRNRYYTHTIALTFWTFFLLIDEIKLIFFRILSIVIINEIRFEHVCGVWHAFAWIAQCGWHKFTSTK